MKNGRQQGTHALLGQPRPGEPLVIAEGFATAATLRKVTGLSVAVAFNSGNLGAWRVRFVSAIPSARP